MTNYQSNRQQRMGKGRLKEALGPCFHQPCKNGGQCLTFDWKNFTCVCREGWTGKTCQDKAASYSWSEWSQWGACSVTCAAGWQMRNRTCRNDDGLVMLNKVCGGTSEEYQQCEGLPCPEWSSWASWSECSTDVTCGRGREVRERVCVGGGDCVGVAKETRPCYCPDCEAPVRLVGGALYGEGRVEVFDDVTSSWVSVCGEGWTVEGANVVCRQSGFSSADGAFSDLAFGAATSPYVLHDVVCSGTESHVAACDHAPWAIRPCSYPAGVRCNVDGMWSVWTSWGDCSATCGSGGRSRTRMCDSPPPLGGGAVCEGPEVDVKLCPLPPCPVNGEYKEWALWSECSTACGNGTRVRDRECMMPEHGGEPCEGLPEEGEDCFIQYCPVDGTFSGWSSWSDCSATCEEGMQTRERNCTEPQYGGEPCRGEPSETRDCFLTWCPVDASYSDWSSWSQCGATCGNTTQTRNRTCQPPQYGGRSCDLPEADIRDCDLGPCAEPSEWMEWSVWGLCSATCGGGQRARGRNCTETNGPCEGAAVETTECHNFTCSDKKKTCSDYREAGMVDSNMAQIDPLGLGVPVWVRCNMEDMDGVGVTEIAHDKMGRHRVKGFERAGSFELRLQYNVSDSVIQNLVDVSEHCLQYLSWECRGAAINAQQQAYTYAVDITGNKLDYWAGSSAEHPKSCACGVNGTCAVPTKKCNCDSNDNVWRQDDGYIREKEKLPLQSVKAGDTGNGEGYLTVGPMACFGRSTIVWRYRGGIPDCGTLKVFWHRPGPVRQLNR